MPVIKLVRNIGEVNGTLAKATGSTANMAHGIKRRSCKYSALCPKPCETET